MHLGIEIGFQSCTDFSCDLQDSFPSEVCRTGDRLPQDLQGQNLKPYLALLYTYVSPNQIGSPLSSTLAIWGSALWVLVGKTRQVQLGCADLKETEMVGRPGVQETSRWEPHSWHLCKQWYISLRQENKKEPGTPGSKKGPLPSFEKPVCQSSKCNIPKCKQQIRSQNEKTNRNWHSVFLPWATIVQNTTLRLAGGLKST